MSDDLPTSRLIPTLFILGSPKAGSTFLFSCLRAGPFDPNLVRGARESWRDGGYLLTALGTKKEFNFWGGPGWRWGWEWYVGPRVSLTAWEWQPAGVRAPDDDRRRLRRGENGNGSPSELVDQMCRLNGSHTSRKAAARLACRRFPIECFAGMPVVRPGCALVRPLPSTRNCGRRGQPTCAQPLVRMSHAWPLASEASPRAVSLDPSINAFMNMPDAPGQLQAHHPQASRLKFIILLREPLTRAQSSARMMREWNWDKSSNLSAALQADLANLGRCCGLLTPGGTTGGTRPILDGFSGMEAAASPWRRAAGALAKASDRLLRRFRVCLAHKAPINHVRASIYAAGVVAWFSAGFAPSQFLWLETERMRHQTAVELLRTVGSFAALPTSHLPTLPADVRGACERVGDGGGGRKLGEVGKAAPPVDSRKQTHAKERLPRALVATVRRAFRPFNELLATLLRDVAPQLHGVAWLGL